MRRYCVIIGVCVLEAVEASGSFMAGIIAIHLPLQEFVRCYTSANYVSDAKCKTSVRENGALIIAIQDQAVGQSMIGNGADPAGINEE